MVVGVILAACAGCSSGSGVLDGRGQEAKRVASDWWLMFGLATAVYVIVAGLVIFAVARGRRRAAREGAPDESETSRLDTGFVVVGGILIPVLILAVLAVVTVTTTNGVRNADAGAVRITVTGKRWWWDVQYAHGVRSANEIHIPVGRQVDLTLLSDNVIHSFWVPQLAGKVDMIPGQPNHLRLTAERAGSYRGQCAEFCGIQHAHMIFHVIAQPPAEFDRWLARRTSSAGSQPESDEAAQGQRIFQRESCAGCHTVAGTSAQGRIGPDLSDFGTRRTIAAGTLPNDRTNLAKWIRDPQKVKPGNLMPPSHLSEADVQRLVAYLESTG
jgi:cytochrome c oxidase subunit 2